MGEKSKGGIVYSTRLRSGNVYETLSYIGFVSFAVTTAIHAYIVRMYSIHDNKYVDQPHLP
jgi:hypothetical protein